MLYCWKLLIFFVRLKSSCSSQSRVNLRELLHERSSLKLSQKTRIRIRRHKLVRLFVLSCNTQLLKRQELISFVDKQQTALIEGFFKLQVVEMYEWINAWTRPKRWRYFIKFDTIAIQHSKKVLNQNNSPPPRSPLREFTFIYNVVVIFAITLNMLFENMIT